VMLREDLSVDQATTERLRHALRQERDGKR